MSKNIVNIPIHMVHARVPHREFKALSIHCKKTDDKYVSTLATRLLLAYLTRLNNIKLKKNKMKKSSR